jgi:hypothetical protein
VDEVSQQRVKLYLDDISSQLQRQGIQVEGRYSISGNKYKVVFGPKGVNKKTPLDHLTSKWREVTSAVTLGDNDNDREKLLAEKFGTKEGGLVPNYPILVGDHVDLSQRVSQMENGLLVSSANVSEGLKVQAEKALTTGVRKLARFA